MLERARARLSTGGALGPQGINTPKRHGGWSKCAAVRTERRPPTCTTLGVQHGGGLPRTGLRR